MSSGQPSLVEDRGPITIDELAELQAERAEARRVLKKKAQQALAVAVRAQNEANKSPETKAA
jgi:hypothetical protein